MMYEVECVLPHNAWAADIETVTIWNQFGDMTALRYTEYVMALKDEILNALNGPPP